jgi:TatD DNase family protein
MRFSNAPIADAHIHLDSYAADRTETLLRGLAGSDITAVIAVSMHLESCRVNETWARRFPSLVFPAYGQHPEQTPLGSEELEQLAGWIRKHADGMVAIGEIGLPYYTRKEAENKGEPFDLGPYVAQLDRLLQLAEMLDKPVVLHAVYEDAELACDLLEKYPPVRAHFHWFKGSDETILRMIRSGYYVSVTPDVLYEDEIRQLVRKYPLELLMAETDGPWPFEGPFAGRETHPGMIRDSIRSIAGIKGVSEDVVRRALFENTVRLYRLPFAT